MPLPPPTLTESTAGGELRLFCPAKINLALSVGSPRDDGLHPIASWMVPIAFGDTLTLRRADEPGGVAASVSIRFAGDAPLPGEVDWPIERDLAVRAWRIVEEEVGRPLPIKAHVLKRVPAGAGLGGGSADAAGMLDGLDQLFSLDLGIDRLKRLAAKLGSDVVFQLQARRTPSGAVVTGTGDVITMLPSAEPFPLFLLLPPFGCPTGAVYDALDQTLAGRNHAPDIARVQALARAPRQPASPLFNDLSGPACLVRPALRSVLKAAAQRGNHAHVTGSGAAVFIPADAADAAAIHERCLALENATGCAVIFTQTAG